MFKKSIYMFLFFLVLLTSQANATTYYYDNLVIETNPYSINGIPAPGQYYDMYGYTGNNPPFCAFGVINNEIYSLCSREIRAITYWGYMYSMYTYYKFNAITNSFEDLGDVMFIPYNGLEANIIEGSFNARNVNSKECYLGTCPWEANYYTLGDDAINLSPDLISSTIPNSNIIAPTNLKQQIQSPYLDKQEINLGEKIGKFQSGSGIILSADVEKTSSSDVRLKVEVFEKGNLVTLKYMDTSTGVVNSGTGKLSITVPYSTLGTGEFYWRARVVDENGNESDFTDFEENTFWEVDFSLYDGFEPYPYGYKFYNKGPADGVLDGGVVHIPLLAEIKVDGNKWDIFESAFDLTSFNGNPVKINDAFESVGLNRSNALQGGNCYGMAVSSLMQYTNSGALFLSNNHPNFSQAVGSGTIWDNINEPNTIKEDGRDRWNEYNDIIKTIYSLQVSQFSTHQRNAENLATTTDGNEILTKFNNNPDKNYVLSFGGIKKVKKEFLGFIWYENEQVGHAVVPYKVEGNKIYFWDNNYQYPFRLFDDGTEVSGSKQFISINSDGTWNAPSYTRKEFTDLALVDINDIINDGNKSAPIGFNGTDATYTLSGSSDLYVVDSIGRISGFYSGSVLEEIPGVEVITPLNATLTGAVENTWKQIYLPQKQDLTVKVSADTDESYDLIVAGGDYYTKISGVETSSGQVDSFIPTRENLQIDFDDNKVGDYDLMIDNFHNSGTGTIYMNNVESKIEPQQYIVSWTGVIDNTEEAVMYEVDTDNDGTFDESINLPPVYQDNIAPTTSYNISGELNTNTTNSYIETAIIDLNAIDNNGGTGVDKIYYAIGTDIGSLVYIEYLEPVIVNGVGDYTLNYYSKDLFGNIEEVKTVSFSLTERPETYAGNISGYVYDDENNNGLEDEGEKRMAGWKVCIDLNNNDDCEEQNEPFNVTNNDGYYEFDSLATGTYKILEIPHQNWIITNPTEGSYTINLQNGQKVEQKNFGNFKVKGGKK